MFLLSSAIFVSILFLLFYMDCRKPKNFPPGPKWYPIIGSALKVSAERSRTRMLCKALHSLVRNQKDKGIIGLKVGADRTVVVMDTDSIKEMYLNEDIDGRPMGVFYRTRTFGQRLGIILTDGELWSSQRRFIIRGLKEFGFARSRMIDIIQNEAEELLKDFREMAGKGGGKTMVPMQNAFGVYMLNTLWTMMAGIRRARSDSQMKELQLILHKLFLNIDMIGCLFGHFPILRFIAPTFSGYKSYIETHEKLYEFIGKEVDNHKRNFHFESEPKDLMDVYLKVIQDPGKNSIITEKQLFAVCLDLFIAGSETTTKSMGVAMLHITRNKNVQIKMQTEIDNVVGRNRLPTLEDRAKMTYCEAVIYESIRLFVGHTFGLPHRAMKDTKLKNYFIPKDTMVIANFSGMLLDPSLWKNPEAFIPERFLIDGKISIPDHYHPFGLGKHRCMGELMAKANLFLFITTLLQNFEFLTPIGHPIPSAELLDGATPSVKEYIALIVER